MHETGGQKEKWPTNGRIGYVNTAVCGVANTSQSGRRSEVAHQRAVGLRKHCRLAGCQRFSAGDKITSGRHMGRLSMSPCRMEGSPTI